MCGGQSKDALKGTRETVSTSTARAAPVGGVMAQRCKTCRWFDPSFAPDEDEHESLGLCEWPADRLPYSLRWGNRERVAVRPLDGSDCPCYEPAQ